MRAMDVPRERVLERLQQQKNEVAGLRFRQEDAGLPDALLVLAKLHGLADEHASARAAYEEAIRLYRTGRNRKGQAECLHGLAAAFANDGNARDALLALDEAAGLYRQEKDAAGEGACHAAAAELLRSLGDSAQAEVGFQHALELFRKAHDHGREAGVLVDLGDLRMAAGDYAAARALFEEALPLAHEKGEREQVALCALLLGEAAGLQGDHAAAREPLALAAAAYEGLQDVAYAARAHWDLGLAHFFVGELPLALSRLESARAHYVQMGHGEDVARADKAIATVRGRMT